MENLVTFPELRQYYGGKKVFVTGHTGFKGSWLTACLREAGATVKGYALAPEYEEGLYGILPPFPSGLSCIADIRDAGRLQEEILAFQPDHIFHLAAQPLVRRSYEIPAETFDVNVTGTACLLEAVTRLENKCAVVVITTDKVYENKEKDILYKETDVLGGYDPYSASKACAELVISSFRNSFFHPGKAGSHGKAIAAARAGNVIGGGDWSRDRLVPDIARSLLRGKTIEVRNPLSVRPWQHVLEPIAGYLRLGGLLYTDPVLYGKAYNFGPMPDDHLTVKDLVQTAIEAWGAGNWKDCPTADAPHEAGLLKLDISLARKELRWEPRLDAREAIRWSLQWYKTPAAERAAFTITQIKSYFNV